MSSSVLPVEIFFIRSVVKCATITFLICAHPTLTFDHPRLSNASPDYHQISVLALLQKTVDSSLTSSNPPENRFFHWRTVPVFVRTFMRDEITSICTKYLDCFAIHNRRYYSLPTYFQPEIEGILTVKGKNRLELDF